MGSEPLMGSRWFGLRAQPLSLLLLLCFANLDEALRGRRGEVMRSWVSRQAGEATGLYRRVSCQRRTAEAVPSLPLDR